VTLIICNIIRLVWCSRVHMTLSVQMDQATFCGLVPVMHNWTKQRCCGLYQLCIT